jgi:hypothetical protein
MAAAPLPALQIAMSPRRSPVRSLVATGASGLQGSSSRPPLSILEEAAVRPATRLQYITQLRLFRDWCQWTGRDWSNPQELDSILVEYFTSLYQDGLHRVAGGTTLAAIKHFLPTFGIDASCRFPRADRALKGWAKLAPGAQRLPLPRVAVFAIAGWLMSQNLHQMATFIMIAFTCYLRPGECFALRGRHLVPPRPDAGAQYQSWSILLHDSDLGIPGKTGLYDDAVVVDLDTFLWPVLTSLRATRQDFESLWDFTRFELSQAFSKACTQLGLNHLGPHLYSLRHGGASDDLLRRRRPHGEVKARGRWAADTSLKRYGKAARLQLEINQIAPVVMAFGQAIESRFVQCIIHQQRYGNLGAGLSVPSPAAPSPGSRRRRRATSRRPAAALPSGSRRRGQALGRRRRGASG